MPENASWLTAVPRDFGNAFLHDFITTYAKKSLLSSKYQVPFLGFVDAGLWVYQKGCLLGRARSDRWPLLITLMLNGGADAGGVFEDLDADALQRAASCQESDSFIGFWQRTQHADLDFISPKSVKQMRDTRVNLEVLLARAPEWASLGIAFGGRYPDMVRRLWQIAYETPPEYQALAKSAGLGDWQALPIADAERQVLAEAASVVSQTSPDALNTLDLLQYLKVR